VLQARRHTVFVLITIALALLLLELTAVVAERLAPAWNGAPIVPLSQRYEGVRHSAQQILADRPTALATFDGKLGWKLRPASENGPDRINAQGLRADRDYAPQPPPGVLRVAVFGDSFVYGSEVSGPESWSAQLERLRPDIEVLNYGVPGYGPDQAYLRFSQEGLALQPRVAMLAITTPALRRLVTVSIALQSASADFLGKPRYVLDARGELQLLPNPVDSLDKVRALVDEPQRIRELGAHDYWYDRAVFENPLYDWSHAVRVSVTAGSLLWRRLGDPDRPLAGSPGGATFNPDSEGFRILTRIIEAFVRDVRLRQAVPLILLLPDGYSTAGARAGGVGVMSTVADWCTRQKLDCLDGEKAFAGDAGGVDPEQWFIRRFHYTPLGNERVARWLERELRDRQLLPPAPQR